MGDSVHFTEVDTRDPRQSQFYRYVATIQNSHWTEADAMAVKPRIDQFMKEHCKEWMFQLEKGEASGNYHFQVYFSLHVKLAPHLLAKLLYDQYNDLYMCTGHLKVEATGGAGRRYCCKEDTRVQGPWSQEDEKRKRKRDDTKPLVEWQQDVVTALQRAPDNRSILWMSDVSEHGQSGKTEVLKYMEAHHGWLRFELMGGRDLTTAVGEAIEAYTGRLQGIAFNLGRTHDAAARKELYGIIESLKDRQLPIPKYKSRIVTLDHDVHVVVAANMKPERKRLSADRVRELVITDAMREQVAAVRTPDSVDCFADLASKYGCT